MADKATVSEVVSSMWDELTHKPQSAAAGEGAKQEQEEARQSLAGAKAPSAAGAAGPSRSQGGAPAAGGAGGEDVTATLGLHRVPRLEAPRGTRLTLCHHDGTKEQVTVGVDAGRWPPPAEWSAEEWEEWNAAKSHSGSPEQEQAASPTPERSSRSPRRPQPEGQR